MSEVCSIKGCNGYVVWESRIGEGNDVALCSAHVSTIIASVQMDS